MRDGAHISVVIPALDEAASIGKVLDALPDWVDDPIVVDNGSSDGTGRLAETHGARVVHEPRRGYGSACLAGLAALGETDVVVFLDADFSDVPSEMGRLVDGIVRDEADFVLGERIPDAGCGAALTRQQRYGNALACTLVAAIWGHRYRDLGPFRAIGRDALETLEMTDRGFGWTIEMQIKAIEAGLRIHEVPVRYRPRIGHSKISGTLRGVIGASYKILLVIFVLALRHILNLSGFGSKRTNSGAVL